MFVTGRTHGFKEWNGWDSGLLQFIFTLRVKIASVIIKSPLRYYRQYTVNIWSNSNNLFKLATVKADIHLNYTQNFDVLLTVHLSITLVNDQLDAQFLYFIIRLLQSSTCFEPTSCSSSGGQIVLIHHWYQVSGLKLLKYNYFIIRLLQSSTCFEQRRAHHQEVKLY